MKGKSLIGKSLIPSIKVAKNLRAVIIKKTVVRIRMINTYAIFYIILLAKKFVLFFNK